MLYLNMDDESSQYIHKENTPPLLQPNFISLNYHLDCLTHLT
jgi:hypothetical protein